MKTRVKVIKTGTLEEVETLVNRWLDTQENITIGNFSILPLLIPPSNVMVVYVTILYIQEGWQ